jgi:hypothetical protein
MDDPSGCGCDSVPYAYTLPDAVIKNSEMLSAMYYHHSDQVYPTSLAPKINKYRREVAGLKKPDFITNGRDQLYNYQIDGE